MLCAIEFGDFDGTVFGEGINPDLPCFKPLDEVEWFEFLLFDDPFSLRLNLGVARDGLG